METAPADKRSTERISCGIKIATTVCICQFSEAAAKLYKNNYLVN